MTTQLPPFRKYVAIPEVTAKQLGSCLEYPVEVFEKIDGGNCQIRNFNGRIVIGSKANYLIGPIVSKTVWFSRLVNWANSTVAFYSLPQNVILFGEWAGHHTIVYDRANIDKFFMIDILDLENDKFLSYDSSMNFLKGMNIPEVRTTEILARGVLKTRDIADLLKQPSSLYSGPKEGLVIKAYDSPEQSFFKILNKGFSEKRDRIFGKADPFTDARFRKNILQFNYHHSTKPSFDSLVHFIREDVRKETGRSYKPAYVARRLERYISSSPSDSATFKTL